MGCSRDAVHNDLSVQGNLLVSAGGCEATLFSFVVANAVALPVLKMPTVMFCLGKRVHAASMPHLAIAELSMELSVVRSFNRRSSIMAVAGDTLGVSMSVLGRQEFVVMRYLPICTGLATSKRSFGRST